MNDTTIGDLWKTAFGKEFGGLAQGDIKTKTMGTNAIFIMSHKYIEAYRGKYTYARVCLDHLPQMKTRIAFGSPPVETSSNTQVNCQYKLLTSQHPSYYGTVSSAQKTPNTCALI
jgi:hypothetical protein